jgi:HSP20 family molecular chaperone IbpA
VVPRGNDQDVRSMEARRDHWLRAERELAVQDVSLSVESDAVTVRMAMAQFSGSPLVISISGRSLLILSVPDEVTNTVEETDREMLHFISLPVEVDPAQVTCEADAGNLALRLPLVEVASTLSRSACV